MIRLTTIFLFSQIVFSQTIQESKNYLNEVGNHCLTQSGASGVGTDGSLIVDDVRICDVKINHVFKYWLREKEKTKATYVPLYRYEEMKERVNRYFKNAVVLDPHEPMCSCIAIYADNAGEIIEYIDNHLGK